MWVNFVHVTNSETKPLGDAAMAHRWRDRSRSVYSGVFRHTTTTSVSEHWPPASTPPGMPGTHPPIFWLGGHQREYPPILLRTFGYSRPILAALRSLSLKPISFGYKTPPVRFSQAGGQSAHKARPPNLQLALTPMLV